MVNYTEKKVLGGVFLLCIFKNSVTFARESEKRYGITEWEE